MRLTGSGSEITAKKMTIKTHEMIPGASPEELEEVLQSLATEWGDDMDSFQVKPLTGAMTNEVFQINWSAKNGNLVRKVLVRVYGEGVEMFFNRGDEIRTFECLSKHGYGPRLLGRFAGGRVEEFIHARVNSQT